MLFRWPENWRRRCRRCLAPTSRWASKASRA